MSHEPSEFTASTEPVYQAVSKPILFVWYRALIRRPTRSPVPAIGGVAPRGTSAGGAGDESRSPGGGKKRTKKTKQLSTGRLTYLLLTYLLTTLTVALTSAPRGSLTCYST